MKVPPALKLILLAPLYPLCVLYVVVYSGCVVAGWAISEDIKHIRQHGLKGFKLI
jgi:hypothetical protein